MAYIVGLVLALLVVGSARWVGFDRDRSFYPVVVIVVASYYVLFAVLGGSIRALILELMVMGVFVVAAVVGMKRSVVLVGAALAGHGVMDFFHGYLIKNPGLPEWWPAFCGSFDVVAGVLVFVMIQRRQRLQGV